MRSGSAGSVSTGIDSASIPSAEPSSVEPSSTELSLVEPTVRNYGAPFAGNPGCAEWSLQMVYPSHRVRKYCGTFPIVPTNGVFAAAFPPKNTSYFTMALRCAPIYAPIFNLNTLHHPVSFIVIHVSEWIRSITEPQRQVIRARIIVCWRDLKVQQEAGLKRPCCIFPREQLSLTHFPPTYRGLYQNEVQHSLPPAACSRRICSSTGSTNKDWQSYKKTWLGLSALWQLTRRFAVLDTAVWTAHSPHSAIDGW